jgi:hypothetical protein
MSKDTLVRVINETTDALVVHNRVTKAKNTVLPGEIFEVRGNRGSEDDVIIGIMDPAIKNGGATVGRFRFENPDIGYSWMKSDFSQYSGPYAMRGYGKLSPPYGGYDYVVQAAKDQKIATGKLQKHQKYIFGKSNTSYNPTPEHPEKGIWAFKSSDFIEDQYLLSKGFKVIAHHEWEWENAMLWNVRVVDLKWYQDSTI